MRSRLHNGKRLEQAAEARDAVLEKILDLVEVPLPDAVVDQELQARRDSVQQQLAMAGMTMEQYLDTEKQTVDEFEADLEKRVRDAVAAQFVLDQVAKAEDIAVNESELQEHLMRRAQQSGQNPQEFISAHARAQPHPRDGRRGRPRQGARADRGVRHRHRRVRQPVELKTCMPDGTIGEPGRGGESAADEADEGTAAEAEEKADA